MPRPAGTPLADLPDPLPVPVIPRARIRSLDSVIRPPGSKSLTNRALLLAALADGTSHIARALIDADDAERMIEAVATLGATVTTVNESDLMVKGVSGRWATNDPTLFLNNAGTATRFLAASSVLSTHPIVIDGNARMRQRPIGELGDALHELGVDIEYSATRGYPPLRLIPPPTLPIAPLLEMGTTQSSQVISGLLLIAPWIPGGITLKFTGEITSASYVQMTLSLLSMVGATVRTSEDMRVVRVAGPRPDQPGLPAFQLDVEPDASGATYFWAAAALLPGARCTVSGIGRRSIQGDAGFAELLERMGAEIGRAEDKTICRGSDAIRPILADMSQMPDAAMTLACVACFADGPSVLRGLRTLRVKETDRIAALQQELGRVDVRVDVRDDGDAITLTPPPGGIACPSDAPPVEFETYDDHRMAMSLALIGLRRPNVLIRDPGCVRKTYPGFWADLSAFANAG